MAKAGEATSWVQWASVAGAALSIAFIVAETERGIDKSKKFRMDYPRVHGYLPDDKCRAFLVSFGTFCFIGGTVVSKWAAIASLATVSASIAAGWLSAEFIVLLLLRYIVEGSWRL